MQFPFLRLLTSIATTVALAIAFVGCDASAPSAQEAPPPPPEVGVATPVERVLAEWDVYTGRLEAVERVDVRARVTGFVQDLHFDEGSMVRRGEDLYTLDPRTFTAVRDAARARADEARSLLELARGEAERAETLIAARAVSQEELDQRRRQVDTASATLAAAEASLASAELDVEFTRVTAPVAGRVGRALVTEGNLVSGGSGDATVLTTIVSIDPIYLNFSVDEASAQRLLERFEHGGAAVPLELQLGGETGFPHPGRLDFLDNRIDENTGTLLARAIFDNEDGTLVPGAFGRVRLQIDPPRSRLLIPDKALGTDQTLATVMVVGDDGIVERRIVTTGPVRDGMRVIREGIAPGEQVIVEGLPVARAGAVVRPRPIEPTR